MRKQKSQDHEFSSLQRKRSLRLQQQSSFNSLNPQQISNNQSAAAFDDQVDRIPTSFNAFPGLQRRSSSRLRKNNISTTAAASSHHSNFVRETSVKMQIYNKPDDFGDNPQQLQKMLQAYDRQHAFYLESSITQQMQLFLRRIVTNKKNVTEKLSQHPLLKIFNAVMKALMMNEMQIVVWSLLLEKFKWFIDASNLTHNYDIEQAAQKIEQTLYIIGFLAKKITNNEQKTDRIQEINQQWNNLSKPLNPRQDADVIDYNYEVDNILQISPPYHSENNEESKTNPNKRNNADNRVENFAKPPPLLPIGQKGKRGRPRKNSNTLLNPRKRKEEQSEEYGSSDIGRDKVKQQDQFFAPSNLNQKEYQTRYGRIAKPSVDNQKIYYGSYPQRPNRIPSFKQEYSNKRGALASEKQKKKQKDNQFPPDMHNTSDQQFYENYYNHPIYYSSQAYPNQNMVPYIPAKFPPPPPHHVFGIGTAPQYSRQDSIFQNQKNEISKITSGNGAFQSVSPHKFENHGNQNFLAGINTGQDLTKRRSGRGGAGTATVGEFDKDMPPLQMQRNFSSLSMN